MLAESWKKICLIILIIACLWNIISKLMHFVSFDETLKSFKEKNKQEQTVKLK